MYFQRAVARPYRWLTDRAALAQMPSPGAPRAALEALRHVRIGGIVNVANMPERTRRCTVRHSLQRLKDREADGVRRLALTLHTKGAELHLGMRKMRQTL
ncbi:hypothetical protein BwSH17_72470 [Bradyrhizobium ottawaense]|nr:hypothetical protein BwSH17_72470 [Bradyrhizobium ottawaense]